MKNKKGTVLNTIKGYLAQKYVIDEIVIIDGFDILYDGMFEKFYKDCDINMYVFRRNILSRNVVAKRWGNGGQRRLYLFLENTIEECLHDKTNS